MIEWYRRRHPDDVPTPIAVAVSDFCRRARAPASAAQVREALSLLTEADDFRVRALTDGEPEAKLGPFAVIDVISGTAPSVAAVREETGYYELVQALAVERAKKTPTPSAPVRLPPAAEAAAWSESAGQPPETRRPVKTKPKSIAEKIAPKKRAAGSAEAAPLPPELPLPSAAYLPKRALPAPRGRFTRVETARAAFEDLLAPAMKPQLSSLIDQTSHRIQMRQALELGYSGKRGVLSVEDVEEAVETHKLRPRLEKKEKEVLIASLTEARGSSGRAATAMGMTPQEMTHLVDTLSLRREVDEVRSHWVREALSPKNLSARFDMLGRSRYLQDLGIEAKFQTALRKDLEKLLKAASGDGAFDAVLRAVALENGLNLELLSKTVDRLGLTPEESDDEPDEDFVED